MKNIATVSGLIKNDCHIKVRKITSKVRMSYKSVETIILDELGFQKFLACWVPSLLTNKIKQNSLDVS